MGIGNELVNGVEELLTARVLRQQALHRMIGEASQCWRAEEELQDVYHGMRALLLPSASVGLSLILEVLDFPPGREVLITPFGWLSNWSCILRAGLIPRFLPLDSMLQLKADYVAGRITEQTSAVIVTHLMGRGQQESATIASLCAERDIVMLEDVAQSFGVSVNGRRAGTFGAAAWCSLNHHKVLSTGDGGFVLVKDPDIHSKLSALHDQGCIIERGKRRPFDTFRPGLSLRETELIAAVLRGQLARFHLIRARSLALHEVLAHECQASLGLEVLKPQDGDLPFTVLFKRGSEVRYPSLLESGWHVAANVPWLQEACDHAGREDAAFEETCRRLGQVSALGAGFVDPYYAVPLGLTIKGGVGEVSRIIRALEDRL